MTEKEKLALAVGLTVAFIVNLGSFLAGIWRGRRAR